MVLLSFPVLLQHTFSLWADGRQIGALQCLLCAPRRLHKGCQQVCT